MADSKFTPALTIHKSDLPITCKLDNPPKGLTIAAALLFDANGAQITLGISASKVSFVIPNTVIPGMATLEVAVTGGPKPFTGVKVVEDSTDQQLIMSILDPGTMFAIADVAVLA
jgi:hypothetical protein